jgi:uncharacterized membrane protein YeaQ/YmgE (transglycosylase-associated protein family)
MPVSLFFRKRPDRFLQETVVALSLSGNVSPAWPSGGAQGRNDMPTGILGWLLIGLVAGVLGKLILPGRDPGGIVVTILFGIAGALLAFYLTPLLGLHVADRTWQAYGAATLGAVVLLALYRLVLRRRV